MDNVDEMKINSHNNEENLETKKLKCPKCGNEIAEEHAFCPKCGMDLSGKTKCSKCGSEILPGQDFCPKCGKRIKKNTESKKKKIIVSAIVAIIICVVALIVALLVVLALIFLRPRVDEVLLAKESIQIKVDDSQSITYTISPDKASKTKVSWESSNESVATVNENGVITGKGDGVCTITISAGRKTDTITVTVKSGPDFKKVYNDYCNSSWATLASDGSYLNIDTNPNDKDDYFSTDAYLALIDVVEALGIPEYLLDEMDNTNALMGSQSEEFDDLGISVRWSYHPNNGLEVTFKAK